MVYGRSVTAQKHRQKGNYFLLHFPSGTPGVGSGDAYSSKNRLLRKAAENLLLQSLWINSRNKGHANELVEKPAGVPMYYLQQSFEFFIFHGKEPKA